MRRAKRHKVKQEKGETSSAYERAVQDHDLAYYIHDRVGLMQQVFSVLKTKDILAMAPACVRKLSIDNLQELCTEELLGISSKRLCATLDGAEPPSDTETSSRSPSPAPLETISLDSISSDDELLSQGTRRKKKHKRRESRSKAKKARTAASASASAPPEPPDEQSRASRAGLTVLELLELQARARAIRAQLQQDQARKAAESSSAPGVSTVIEDDDEVEIKEEAPEVVEISSEDEKPDVARLDKVNAVTPSAKQPAPTTNGKDDQVAPTAHAEKEKPPKDAATSKEGKKQKKDKTKKKKKDKDREKEKEPPVAVVAPKATDADKQIANDEQVTNTFSNSETQTQTVQKRVNDLVITIPKQATRKIKLNRSKMTVSIPNVSDSVEARPDTRAVSVEEAPRVTSVVVKPPERLSSVVSKPVSNVATTAAGCSKKPTDAEDKRTEEVAGTMESSIGSLAKSRDKPKKKTKKKEHKKSTDKEGSDHDEITLQLSDSEKMDLLENLDRKNFDDVSSSEDSDSSSSTDSGSDNSDDDSSVENLTESPTQSAEVAGISQPDNIIVEVANDNFYKGVEGLEKETVENVDKDMSQDKVNEENVSDSGDSSSASDSDENTQEEDSIRMQDVEMIETSPRDTGTETTATRNDEDTARTQENLEKQQNTEVSELDGAKTIENTTNSRNPSMDISEVANNIEINEISDIPLLNDGENDSQSNAIENDISIHEIIVKDTEPEVAVEDGETPKSTETNKIEENNKNVANNMSDLNNDTVNVAENVETFETEATLDNKTADKKDLSEGELSSNSSSEVEAFEPQAEVVFISDEEVPSNGKKSKKKKDKKSKKEKKAKKNKSDFRESGDQNFFKQTKVVEIADESGKATEAGDCMKKIAQVMESKATQIAIKDVVTDKSTRTMNIEGDCLKVVNSDIDAVSINSNDDVYEFLELSDDSSCYEVEGTVLSKEPTADEIAALSAKIDEIERVEVITEEQIEEHERLLHEKGDAANKGVGVTEISSGKETEDTEKSDENLENMTWKDRYLGSKKVKKVMSTANILNALRKKNKELKRKLCESKKKEAEELQMQLQKQKEEEEKAAADVNKELEEGSVEQYNTLLGSTKYVDPVPDPSLSPKEAVEKDTEDPEEAKIKDLQMEITGEMKKDAKQLLKMYKKLLKYNDITKQRDPNKPKKKKKRSKKKDSAIPKS